MDDDMNDMDEVDTLSNVQIDVRRDRYDRTIYRVRMPDGRVTEHYVETGRPSSEHIRGNIAVLKGPILTDIPEYEET